MLGINQPLEVAFSPLFNVSALFLIFASKLYKKGKNNCKTGKKHLLVSEQVMKGPFASQTIQHLTVFVTDDLS